MECDRRTFDFISTSTAPCFSSLSPKILLPISQFLVSRAHRNGSIDQARKRWKRRRRRREKHFLQLAAALKHRHAIQILLTCAGRGAGGGAGGHRLDTVKVRLKGNGRRIRAISRRRAMRLSSKNPSNKLVAWMFVSIYVFGVRISWGERRHELMIDRSVSLMH